MKTPPGMSKTVTHRLIIADRSKAGMDQVASILEMFPDLKELVERIATWRGSTDQFFVFIVARENNGSVGAVRATDLQHLLKTIEGLFETHLLPPANPSFDIVVNPPDNRTIHDHIGKLLFATVAALRAGTQPDA